jgi:hypothetical protein
MRWLNARYIKELDFETFTRLAKPFYDKSVIPTATTTTGFRSFCKAESKRWATLSKW